MTKLPMPVDDKYAPIALPALNLPLQQAKARFGYSRSKTLTRWAEALPLGNTSVAAHQLLAKLSELNQTRYSVRERLTLLNILRPLLNELTQTIRQPLQVTNLPLAATAQYNARLLQNLLEAMSSGYKLIVNELALTPRLKEYSLFQLQESIYLAMIYLAERLLDAYRFYMSEPAHVWMDLNQLYQYACKRKLEYGNIDDPHPDSTTSFAPTIDFIYKRIVLLALAEPYRLMQHEAADLYQLVGASVPDCTLEPFSEFITQGEYVIDLDTDQGPRYITAESDWQGRDPRLIDISRVKAQLNRQLQHLLRNNMQTTEFAGTSLLERQQRDMLLRLADAWQVSQVRKNQRFRLNAKVELTAGLNASHYFVSDGAPFTPEVNALKLAHELDAHDDPQHSMFATLYREALQKDRKHIRHQYPLNIWRQRDVSPLGIALNCEESGQALDIGVGELVCYRFTEQRLQRWQLGVIRWLKTHYADDAPGNIDIGILNLATGAIPIGVKAVRGQGQGTDYFRSLLIPRQVSLQQIRSLIVPALLYDIGTLLTINIKQRLMHVRLTRVLRSTRAFTQFDFEVVKSSTTAGP